MIGRTSGRRVKELSDYWVCVGDEGLMIGRKRSGAGCKAAPVDGGVGAVGPATVGVVGRDGVDGAEPVTGAPTAAGFGLPPLPSTLCTRPITAA